METSPHITPEKETAPLPPVAVTAPPPPPAEEATPAAKPPRKPRTAKKKPATAREMEPGEAEALEMFENLGGFLAEACFALSKAAVMHAAVKGIIPAEMASNLAPATMTVKEKKAMGYFAAKTMDKITGGQIDPVTGLVVCTVMFTVTKMMPQP